MTTSAPDPLWYVVYTFDDGHRIARATNWVAVDDLVMQPHLDKKWSVARRNKRRTVANMIPGVGNMLAFDPARAAAFGLFSPDGDLISGVRWDWWMEELVWLTKTDVGFDKSTRPWPATTDDARYLRGFLLDMFFYPGTRFHDLPLAIEGGDHRLNPPIIIEHGLEGRAFEERAAVVDAITAQLLEDHRRRELAQKEFYDELGRPSSDEEEKEMAWWFKNEHGFHPVDDVMSIEQRSELAHTQLIPAVRELITPIQASIYPECIPEVEKQVALPSSIDVFIWLPGNPMESRITLRFFAPQGGWQLFLEGGTDRRVAVEPTLTAMLRRINWLVPASQIDQWYDDNVIWGTPTFDDELFQLLNEDGPLKMGLDEFTLWANAIDLLRIHWAQDYGELP